MALERPPVNPIFCALDRAARAETLSLARRLRERVGGLKLGLEFFVANGPEGVRAVAGEGMPLFLDLKLHDIPNTVAGAVGAIARLPVTMTTLHASGGEAMLRAAREARDGCGSRLRLLAVTVLTSLERRDLERMGMTGSVTDQVTRLAETALAAGIDGLVCSPLEVAPLRARFGPDPLLVVPGIRSGPAGADDQKRTTTAAAALAAGADYLVVGRPITAAPDPAAAAAALLRELGEAA